jgi:hypothetical protein
MSKAFEVVKARMLGSVDIFNLLNASAPISINTTYGSAWQRPTNILLGRFVKFSLQMNF